MSVIKQCDFKNSVNASAKCHATEKQVHVNGILQAHPFYLLDLALYNFWLFPKVRITMKGKHFQSIQNIEAAMAVELNPLRKEDFQNRHRK